jgi:hypothetical protein
VSEDLKDLLYSFEEGLNKEELIKWVVGNGGTITSDDPQSNIVIGIDEDWCGVTPSKDKNWRKAIACYTFLDFKETVKRLD